MRVIFKSEPALVTIRDPRNGRMNDGVLQFELLLLDEGEDPTPAALKPKMASIAAGSTPRRFGVHPLRDLRARAKGGRVEIPPPSTTTGAVPVVVPESVLASLPDSAEFVLQWQITPRAQP